MKLLAATLLVAAAIGAARTTHADPAADAADDADTMVLQLREAILINVPGATAAFSVDPTVAEVSAADGRLSITARGVGSTTISIITATDVRSIPLVVAPLPPHDPVGHAHDAARAWTVVQSSYESSSERLTSGVEMVDGGDKRTLRAYAVNAVDFAERMDGDADARASMPAMALEWRTARDEVVLFDKLIQHSALTLDDTTVRGAHLRVRGLELHAGVTSPLLYQDVFLSTQREAVLGASYELRRGRSSLTPSVYAYPSAAATGGTEGTMGSLMYMYRSREDHLRVRGELGWGGVPGAAADVTYEDDTQRAWISARHEPRGFAAIGAGRPLGSMVDGVWTTESKQRVNASVATTVARYETAAGPDQDVATTTGEVRIRLRPHLTGTVGAALGRFRTDPTADPVYSITAPVGLQLETRGLGVAGLYRYEANSARNRGGHGGRLTVRGRRGALRMSAYGDVQQEAATLDVILDDQPMLAEALAELGLTASSPDELARLLRENATLEALGYAHGASLSFQPWRAQAVADVTWAPADDPGGQLRLRALFDRTRTVSRSLDTRSAALSYQHRFGSAVEANAQVAWWSREEEMRATTTAWSIAAGVTVRIDSVPAFGGHRHRTIEGTVVDAHGGSAPVAGVTVHLDGSRAAITDRAGRFVFADVEAGEHDVDADLPESSFFVGPQRVTTRAGGSVTFAVARSQTRLSGTVRDDMGAGIAGVTVVVRGGDTGVPAITDTSGRFQLALLPGDYTVEPQASTLPAGYDTSGLAPQPLHVAADTPVTLELRAPALRSIAGTVHAPEGQAIEVRIVELGRTAEVDAEGHYVFRGLAPDRYTVEATVAGRPMRRSVEVPAGPASIRGVDFQ